MTKSLELGLYVVTEYLHLSHANDLPSYISKLEWRATDNMTLYQSVYYGPDQQATAMQYWRTFADSTVEWRTPDWRVALSYDVGTEKVADVGGARATWMGAALFTQRHLTGPWSVAVRPEFYWDPQGRMTERTSNSSGRTRPRSSIRSIWAAAGHCSDGASVRPFKRVARRVFS